MLQHLAGRVWLYPHDPDPDNIQACVAVIAGDGDRGSVIVDAGNSPGLAREVRTAMERQALPEARWLVYTHHHWDHVWGAVAWPDVEIVGHAAGRPLLEAEARRPWSHEYLRREVAANPRLGPSFRARAWAMPTWEGFRILPPHTVFDDTLTLPAGVELRHVGGRHAPDSIVVGVPDSKVLLLGDCYFAPPFHLRAEGDKPDLDLVQRLIDPRYEWYVDAHSSPWRADGVGAYSPP